MSLSSNSSGSEGNDNLPSLLLASLNRTRSCFIFSNKRQTVVCIQCNKEGEAYMEEQVVVLKAVLAGESGYE